jgi:RNA polymerase sigma-70 factor, ECF subfamily
MPDPVAWDQVKRAADGSPEARRDLVDATIGNLWSLALRLTRRRDDADDIVQETYARVLAILPKLEPTGPFEAYLARTAANLVVERWRRKRPAAPLTDALAAPGALEPWQTVAATEDHRRQLAAAWAAIQKLDPEPRAAVVLFYAHGESCEGIARILNVPIGTVKTWLHRSRNSVRESAAVLLRQPPPLNSTLQGEVS